MIASKDLRALVILLLLAAGLRGIALWKFGGQLASDPDAYQEIAGNIVGGRGFSFGTEGIPTAYRPPLYPCLLVAARWVAGHDEALARRVTGAIHLFLGTASVWLVLIAARRLVPGRAAWLAALLAAIDPLLVYNTSLAMTETTATFLVALLVCLWLSERGRGGDFALGAVFGLCCLCRPTFWAVGFLCVAGWGAAFAFRRFRGGTAGGAHSSGVAALRGRGAVVVVGAVVTVAPWVIRNLVVMGKPILTTTHGGYTLLLAHNPLYTREVVNRGWGAVWAIDANAEWESWIASEMRSEFPEIDPAEKSIAAELFRDRWMSRRAWKYIADDPGTAVRTSGTLLGRIWNVVPMMVTKRGVPGWMRLAIGVFYSAVFLAALAGLLRIQRGDWPRWWPLVALLLGFTVVHSLYWADMRMRAPLMPAVFLLAAHGVMTAPRRMPGDGSS
jgi:4-amino-4-deoxy-L-arabinose transferase-like glycosyltransferase